MCHVSPVVLPALLAGIETRMPSQTDALGAFALGLETTVRLCRAMRPDLYQGARWHAPGVIGPFGAATTYALLHGLDDSALRRSWGSAELQSSGTFSAIGSPGVKFTQARGALAGVLAVELALRGHGAAANPFSHPDGGLFDAYGGGDPALATDGLDRDWVLDDISLRRWPAASSLQSLVEAVLALRTDSPELPQSIRIQLPEQSWKLCAGMLWADQLEALQSARWVASVVWADGECWTEQFSTSRIADEELGAFAASRVEVVLDDSLPRGAVRVVAKTAQGAIEHEILTALGSPERPLSRDDVEAKLERAAGRDRALRIRDLLSDDGWDPAGLIRCLAEAPWSATAPPRR
jgi:2-methylcitrate dehydratase PrpD